ncbi:MAG: hypothetical protein CVV44_12370 [Spirochaetae bacterium HGW-Spirochaetae-1]|jgi:anti-anti-sigma factor|nr:MAG: hypothetical protein CVV44_12370 [Spirochaetae bacterium HGW-Spirochaetae-1]
MNASVKEEKKGSGDISLSIKGDMTIYTVNELKQSLLNGLEGSTGQIELDLGQVSRIDTAGYQLLLLLDREALAENKKIVIKKLSGEVKRLFNLYKYSYQ